MTTNCMIDGNPNAPILIIGMSPGREELAANKPFVGGAGKLLWTLLNRAGIRRDQCYIINAIGELPEKKDGNPSDEQIDAYWERFNDALMLSTAQYACCLGGVAFDRLTGILSSERAAKRRSGIEQWRGYIVRPAECQPQIRKVTRYGVYKTNTKTHKKGDPKKEKHALVETQQLPSSLVYIFPTIHPAGVLRSGMSTLPALAADLVRVGRFLRREGKPDVCTWSEAPFLSDGRGPISVDIETLRSAVPGPGLITRIGMSTSEGTWTAPWSPEVREIAIRELGHPDRTVIIHNAPFDIQHLAAEGVTVRGKIFDTMLGALTIQPDLYKGLNSVASLYLDVHRWKHLSEETPAAYNAADAYYERRLFECESVELKRQGQLSWFRDRLMPGAATLMRMTQRGIKLDREARERWVEELIGRTTKAAVHWAALSNGCDPASPAQTARFLYDTLGMPMRFNKTGGPTTEASTLKELRGWVASLGDTERAAHLRMVLDTLLAYREDAKLLSTYTKSPLDDDDRIHPSYLPASKDDDSEDFGKGMAGTGRITSRDPNIQNQPPAARALYIPSSKDFILVEADYGQIELRIAAALAGDEALTTDLQGDVFARIQERLGCDRVRAKNVVYGTLYGAGPRKLKKVLQAKGFDITEREARTLQDQLATTYPKLFQWRQRVINEVGRTYRLTTPFGQRRYFYGGRNNATAALDFLPQGTAAGIMWTILPQLERDLYAHHGWPIATIHDAVLIEVLREYLDRGVAAMRHVMEQEWPMIAPGFRVPVKFKVGENWRDMTEWTDN